MKLLIIKIVAVALIMERCESATRKRSVEIQPVNVEEIQIEDSQLKPNEIPLVLEPIPTESVGDPTETRMNSNYSNSETMEAANNLVFRPLFSYRKQNVERRSTTSRQQSRRGDTTAGGGRSKYGPPPYLVYNRQTGTYYPYYYYPKYNNVRRG